MIILPWFLKISPTNPSDPRWFTMAPKLRLLAPRPTQLSQWERSLELGAGEAMAQWDDFWWEKKNQAKWFLTIYGEWFLMIYDGLIYIYMMFFFPDVK
jgi:hypothetical protein